MVKKTDPCYIFKQLYRTWPNISNFRLRESSKSLQSSSKSLVSFDETGYQLCFLHGNNHLQQTKAKLGLCEEDHILIKNLYEFKVYGSKRLMKEFPAKWWKKTTLNDFWNICKNNVRLLGSVVVEDWELLVQQQSNITTDCQKNRYPSFISCPYNF